ncbi:hypothetical protein [Isoptericola aurantiacus]|uniref:hypothetical protein n=1 Tax=Isoptericola aurantiacus TaxID=3377839 RepID=UPI00383A15E1
MRDGAPDEVMGTAYRWRSTIQSWGPTGDLLAEDVPLVAGDLSWDVASRGVPEQLTLTVPRYSTVDGDRFDWLPQEDVTHPLATFGQTLTISVTIASTVTGEEYVTPLARVRVQSWDEDEAGQVTVTGVGMLQTAADDVLQVPQSPDEDSTMVSEFARLLPGSLAVAVSDDVTDRACLPGTQWAGPRLDALYDIADALPARLRTDEDGNVVMLLPQLEDVPVPVQTYRDGEIDAGTGMATLISAPRADTRDGIVNSVTVLSNYTSADGTVANVVVEQTTGPFAVDSYGRVSEAWTSEQIGSEVEAMAAGKARLAAGLRPARTVAVQVAPDPRIEVDDPLAVVRDGIERRGYVLAASLDLTGQTATTLTVGITSEIGSVAA